MLVPVKKWLLEGFSSLTLEMSNHDLPPPGVIFGSVTPEPPPPAAERNGQERALRVRVMHWRLGESADTR